MFWVMLVVRLVMWSTFGFVGYWVWSRGVDGFIEDVQGLGEYWWAEYEKYGGEVKRFQADQEKKLRKQGGRGREW